MKKISIFLLNFKILQSYLLKYFNYKSLLQFFKMWKNDWALDFMQN